MAASSSSSASSSSTTPVLFWRGVFDPNELVTDTKVRSAVKDLLKNDFTRGSNLEKLKHHHIYSIRTSRKARLLFSNFKQNGKNCLLLLDYLPNHEYGKSNFLKPGVLERFCATQLSSDAMPELTWEEATEEQQAAITNLEGDPEDFAAVDYYKSSFIRFSDMQDRVLDAKLPLIVSGPPGSGKSCVAISSLTHFLGQEESKNGKRIIYVCLSETLAETMKRYWEQQPLSQETGSTTVSFQSLENLLKELNPELEELLKVTEEEIFGWFKANKVEDPKSVLEEFQILSSYTKEEYLKLGKRQCLFHSEKEKGAIWTLYQQYINWLKEAQKYDIRFEETEAKGLYDLVVVDEAADLSPLTMMHLYNLSKDGSISYFMDTQQDLEDSLSKRIHLKKLMFEKQIAPQWVHLPAVYRCSKSVVDLANRWLGIKAALTGGIADKEEYREIQLAAHDDERTGHVAWKQEALSEVYSSLKERHKETDIAVITTEDKKSDAELEGLRSVMLFTSKEIKGLEFPAVVLYKPFDSEVFKEVNKRLVNIDKTHLKGYQHRSKEVIDPKTKSLLIPELSKVFTSMTRAEDTLVICQNIHHDVRQIYQLMRPPETSSPAACSSSSSSSSSSSAPVTSEYDWLELARKFLDAGQIPRFEEMCRENLKKDPVEVKRLLLGEPSASPATSSRSSAVYASSSSTRASSSSTKKARGKSHARRSKRSTRGARSLLTTKRRGGKPISTQISLEQKERDFVNSLLNKFTQGNIQKLLQHKRKEHFLFDVLNKEGESLAYRISKDITKITLFFETCMPIVLKEPAGEIIVTFLIVLAETIGDKKAIEQLIEKGAHINHQGIGGWNALALAASKGHKEIVELLLEKDAIINLQDINGQTALMVAAANGYEETVALLIEKGANVNLQDKDGQTALMLAAIEGHKDIVALLLEKDANVNLQDKDGQTALMHTAYKGYEDIVALLLEKDAKVNLQGNDGQTALMFSTFNDHKDIVALLLEKGAKVDLQNINSETALTLAAHKGYEEIVTLLLEKDANVNLQDKDGRTALMHAAYKGYEEIVALLLEKDANVNPQDKDGKTALMHAAPNNHKEIVALLLEKDANVNLQDKDGQTALMYAAYKGYEEIVALLLEKDANVNLQDKYGQIVLMYAAGKGYEEIVTLLLEKDANVNLQGKDGRTALMHAASNNHKEIVALLLEKDANVNLQDKDGQIVLMYAAGKGHKEIVALLLEKDANVNLQGNDGQTALMYAACGEYKEIAALLLEKDANVNLQDKKGRTALMHAAHKGHREIVALLVQHLTRK